MRDIVKSLNIFITFGLLVVFILGCGERSDPAKEKAAISEEKAIKNFKSEVFVDKAISITEQYDLSRLPMSCIIFVGPEEIVSGKIIYVTVREKHNEECGGDPDTAPKLYSVGFELNSNEVWTDARSENSMMELLENTEG